MASILTRSQTAARTEDIPKARNVEVEQILGSSKMTGAKELVSREGGEGKRCENPKEEEEEEEEEGDNEDENSWSRLGVVLGAL